MEGNCISAERRRRLVQLLAAEFRLDWRGIHGAPHWARVRVNGLAIAALNGARPDVVELFALLHDSQRLDEDRDSRHGARAGDYIAKLNGEHLALDRLGLDMLIFACRYHSDGMTEADVTIQTCWDADRLDLARVGTWVDKKRLCTDAARQADVFEHAVRRSRRIARARTHCTRRHVPGPAI
jgi:uncharacterized protein